MKLNFDFLAGFLFAWLYLKWIAPWLRAKWQRRTDREDER